MTKKATNTKVQIDSTETSQEILLTFLQQTREGKFAKIDEASLKYARMKETGESFVVDDMDDCYYYSVS